MRYWFVYETLLRGRRRILAKTQKTVEQEAIYNYMSVGDAW
jgi:hypothetical protein